VDTALVRRLLGLRPVPTDKYVIRMTRVLKPDTRYAVRVTDVPNLIGRKGSGEVGFTAPKPAPADTTHDARRTNAPPPPPPPPSPP
jgi:hypothetical protein